MPAFPLVVVVPAPVWREYLHTSPESRAKAILREGEIEITAIASEEADQRLTTLGVSETTRKILTTDDVGETALAAAAAVALATATVPESIEADDRARSAAEAFLFQMLELLPETTGRFELNAELDFRFGPRAAEVDLLCRELRLIIEIDGYFHFRNSEAYRRDRTKDWELQRRGFVIIRFLAEDMLPRYQEVRDRILTAVRTRPLGGVE